VIEQDYILRMIAMLSAMLARVIFFKGKKQFPQAILELQNTGRTLLGIDRGLVRELSSSQLIELFGSDISLAASKAYILSILLKEEADIQLLMGATEDASLLLVKSANLLVDSFTKTGGPLEPRHTVLIDEVLENLRGSRIPADLAVKLLHYHEGAGRYDRAEDAIFPAAADNPELVRAGMEFYGRLLEKADADLEAGNLPRREILEGITSLSKMLEAGQKRNT
jgi:hypothetical protein